MENLLFISDKTTLTNSIIDLINIELRENNLNFILLGLNPQIDNQFYKIFSNTKTFNPNYVLDGSSAITKNNALAIKNCKKAILILNSETPTATVKNNSLIKQLIESNKIFSIFNKNLKDITKSYIKENKIQELKEYAFFNGNLLKYDLFDETNSNVKPGNMFLRLLVETEEIEYKNEKIVIDKSFITENSIDNFVGKNVDNNKNDIDLLYYTLNIGELNIEHNRRKTVYQSELTPFEMADKNNYENRYKKENDPNFLVKNNHKIIKNTYTINVYNQEAKTLFHKLKAIGNSDKNFSFSLKGTIKENSYQNKIFKELIPSSIHSLQVYTPLKQNFTVISKKETNGHFLVKLIPEIGNSQITTFVKSNTPFFNIINNSKTGDLITLSGKALISSDQNSNFVIPTGISKNLKKGFTL